MQHGDGGWGWWKTDDSDDYMTAYVVQGLALAKQAGVDVRSDVLRSGALFPWRGSWSSTATCRT